MGTITGQVLFISRRCHTMVLVAGLLVAAGCGGGESVARDGIVSFAPHITETVFALGAGDAVKGVTDYCDYPPEARELPKVGGYLDPNLERVLMLNPTLIVLQGRHQVIADFAARNGIDVVNVDMDSLEGIREGITTLGEVLDREAEASALLDRFNGELAAIEEAVAGRERPETLIITARHSNDLGSLFTCGGTSFVSHLVALAGGRNLFEKTATPYFEASKETVVMRAPAAILEFHAGEDLTEQQMARYMADWKQLPSLPAVRNGRILMLTASHALRPGPRVPEIAREVAAFLHPDADLPLP